MYRPAARAALRSSQSSLAPARTLQASRRHLTTEAPHLRSRSWKSAALRWGIAGGVIYYYNTSPVFAEYPQSNLLNPNLDALEDEGTHPTLDQITASSRNKAQRDPSTLQSVLQRSSESAAIQKHDNETVNTQTLDSKSSQSSTPTPTPANDASSAESTISDDASDLSNQADTEGAFNPATGEINWDCPCLGGMAYGPCGDEFRAAFSCFVYSNEEPKGMECIEKFSGMQECFRAHPEVYQGELEDDEDQNGEFAEEKEQLRNDIQERRDAVEKRQKETGSGASQRNLLDEAESGETASASASAPKKASKKSAGGSSSTSSKSKSSPEKTPTTSQSSSTSTSSSSSSSWDAPQAEAKTTSHTPFEFAADKEAEHGASSQTVGEPQDTGVDANATPESDSLVPKASHDAR